MKQHWKLTLSYDGSQFHGWQIQPGLATIQGTLAAAIQHVVGEEVLPQGSGRTDAGVHALAQVASLALGASIQSSNLLRALNRMLPSSIRITSACRVSEGFHARHSARAKTYEYRIFRRRSVAEAGNLSERICSPFLAPFVWDCRWPLDLPRMQAAASLVCGTHDFASFAASDADFYTREQQASHGSESSTVRTIWDSSWFEEENLLLYRVRGNGFLHHMVRNLVGTFADVGRGSLEPNDITRIIAACDRSSAGPTAPACGLFLQSVEYDERDEFGAGAG